jgi:hypothetical protein
MAKSELLGRKGKNQLDQRGNTILGANRAGRKHTKRHQRNGNIFFRKFAEKRSSNLFFFAIAFFGCLRLPSA